MFVSLLYIHVVIVHLANLPHKFQSLDQRLRQVSSNSENVENLAVLHGFIKASSFFFQTNLQLLLCLTNLPHKFMGLDQRLDQVSSNSDNVTNLVVLHSFIKAMFTSFYANLQLLYAQQIYHSNSWAQTNVWVKSNRILTTFKIQLFCNVLLKQVRFPFILICSYYYAQQIYHTNSCVQTNVWVNFCRVLRTFKIQLFFARFFKPMLVFLL